MSYLYLNGANVCTGGGLVLIQSLVSSLKKRDDVIFILDSRLKNYKLFESLNIKYIGHGFFSRIAFEIWIAFKSNECDTILCFGNLPTLIASRANVLVYLQNKFLITSADLNGFSILVRLKIQLQRIWFRLRITTASVVFVQTPSMKRDLVEYINLISGNKLKKVPTINIFPFYEGPSHSDHEPFGELESKTIAYDFGYIASGLPHKNHKVLIDAWILLSKEGLFPTLCLTFDCKVFKELEGYLISAKTQHKVKIMNLGQIEHSTINGLYKVLGALIYPSLYESFGLPLLEANRLKVPIVAAELDYVRDIIVPAETFNPLSPHSIANAVKRFLKIPHEQFHVYSPAEFVDVLEI